MKYPLVFTIEQQYDITYIEKSISDTEIVGLCF